MRSLHAIAILLLCSLNTSAQWEPGSVYREYTWLTPKGGELFLRVGGRYGYKSQPEKLPIELQDGDQLRLPDTIDLEGATHAEILLEKVQSHEDSRDLRVVINGHPAITIPEPVSLPDSSNEYMYHTEVAAPIPLEYLEDGIDTRFQLTLDTAQRWGWPQNIFYGITFRIYYAPASAPNLPVIADMPSTVPAKTYLSVANSKADDRAADFVFIGRDTDWSGRGRQHRTHWQTHRGRPHHTIGSSAQAADDFAVAWDTDWLPDQETFAVQVRLLGRDGKYRVGQPLTDLRLAPRPYTVELATSEPAPRNWVTRSGEFEQTINVSGAVEGATELRLNWTSWSPCYANGIYLNGHLIWNDNDDAGCYVYATHSPVYTGLPLRFLRAGENVISTGLTPLFHGQMVHGMEVQWPGVQVKVKYGKSSAADH